MNDEKNDMLAPLVSVVIPIYNDSAFIANCLDKLVDQTFKRFEVWLVDDCSTDDSLSICKKYEAKYPFIHVIENPSNMSAWTCRAKGIISSSDSVEYIMFCDADDYYSPSTIETAYKNIKKFTAVQ